MNAERSTVLVVALLMVLVGSAAWWLYLRPALRVDATPLANSPVQIEGWSSREVPLEENVESMLQADFNLQRALHHSLGDEVLIFLKDAIHVY